MESERILYLGQRVAVTLAGLAILTNALTWLNIALTPVAIVCFLLIFPFFPSGLIAYLIKAGLLPKGKGWKEANQVGREMWSQILDGLPRWQVIGAGLFVAYVFINFFGTAAAFPRVHTESLAPALQVRLMTGHAAAFLLMAAGLFRATRRLGKV
jgi:hypothetical protein